MRLEQSVDVSIDRFPENPLLTPDSDEQIGTNINGPSIIRAPDWFENPLGRYYLYFAHHDGEYIRLAHADDLRGPWEVYTPGTLHLDETRFDRHIASPDIHVDHEAERLRMYFHGCCGPFGYEGHELSQTTDVATSTNGIDFSVRGETLGNSYFRVWEYDDTYYALGNGGHLYSGEDPLSPFELEHELFAENRHFAVRFLESDLLQVFLTRRGDRPERVQVATVNLELSHEEWRANPHPPETVLWPEHGYEGGDLAVSTSETGAALEPVRELRDPAIFEEGDRSYLFYAIAGERGIGGAEIH